jgi:hypothetical protein
MKKEDCMKVEFVKRLPSPEILLADVLYLNDDLEGARHKCPCGCNTVITLPRVKLQTTPWINVYGTKIDITLGIYNKKCKSYYFIKDSDILWIRKGQDMLEK